MWGLFLDCGCTAGFESSTMFVSVCLGLCKFSCVGTLSSEVSFCFHLSITDFVSGSLCVFVKDELSSKQSVNVRLWGPCLFVAKLPEHVPHSSLDVWPRVGDLSTSLNYMEWNVKSLSYLLVYVSGWGVLIGCGGIWGCWNKGPLKMSMPSLWNCQKSFCRCYYNHPEIKDALSECMCTR